MKKRKILSIVLIICMLFSYACNYGEVSAASSSLNRNVYYAYGMSADQLAGIDADKYKITHICYAFIYLTSDGKLTGSKNTMPPASSSYYIDSSTDAKLKALAGLKTKYPWLKIMVSLGGGDDQQTAQFVTVAASQSFRDQLAISCRDLLNAYNLDGIDLDWEQPKDVTEANNYQLVCKDIREEIGVKGKDKLLTAAVPISSSFVNNIMTNQIRAMNAYLDFWNLMTYDLGSSARYSFVAPYDRTSGSETYGFSSVTEGIQMYYNKGVAYADMNLGVPFYGKMLTGLSLSSGSIPFGNSVSATTAKPSYSEIKSYVDSGEWTNHWCEGAKSPYLTYSTGDTITKLVTYDNAESLGYKINLAKTLGVGGMMTWSYKGDDSSNALKTKIAENINMSISSGSDSDNKSVNNNGSESGSLLDVVMTNPGENASTQMNLLWHSPVSKCTLKYTVASDTSFSNAKTVNVTGCINATEAYIDLSAGSYYTYKATLNNLQPDTRYIYKIIASDTTSTTYAFKTAGVGTDFSFGWLADVHANSSEAAKMSNVDTLVNKMGSRSANKAIDFLLFSGDYVKFGNRYSDWKQWKNNTAIKNSMVALVPGNKEYYKKTSTGTVKAYSNQWFLDNTNNPSNGATGVNASYWFIYNNVLFINLDTNQSCSNGVKNWFESVVTKQKGKYQYIVVQKHYPYFKTDNGDVVACDYGDYTKWYSIFDKCGVDFAISADHHEYSRSKQLYNNAVSASANKGTVYLTYPMITAGSGSESTKLSTANGTNSLIAAFATGGSTGAGVFDVNSSKISFKLLDRAGNVIDSTSVSAKRSAIAKPTPTGTVKPTTKPIPTTKPTATPTIKPAISGSYALYQNFNDTFKVGAEKSTANGVWSTAVSSSLGKHVTFKRSTGFGYNDSTSLKADVTDGRYTIDMFCGFQGAKATDVVSFQLYVPSSKITSIKAITVNGTKLLGSKTFKNDQWVTIKTNAIGAASGYVQIQFYSSEAASSDQIYIDNFCIGKQ